MAKRKAGTRPGKAPTKPETPTVSHEWRRWAALSLLDGVPLEEIITTMGDGGIPEEAATSVCERLYRDPAFEAGRWMAQQLHKLQSVLVAKDRLRDLSGVPRQVKRRRGLSREEFLDQHYARNRPVVLEDVCDRWPARARWRPRYLADAVGPEEVEVVSATNHHAHHDETHGAHRSWMAFDDYAARVEATEWSGELYLATDNTLLATAAAAALWDDFEPEARYLLPDDHDSATLWLAPPGTVTPLQQTPVNALVNQVGGWLHVTLIDGAETHRVYNSVGTSSDVDPLAPDNDRFPKFAGAHQVHLNIGPGDALFLPAGWWYQLQALEGTTSVWRTSFAFSVALEWAHPDLVI